MDAEARMRLNHLQLMVGDVAAAADFLTSYFGLKAQAADSDSPVVLGDGSGFLLTLLEGQDHAYPKRFHIGFALPSEDEVNALEQRLEQDGQQPSRAEDAPDGGFLVMAPGGMMIAVQGSLRAAAGRIQDQDDTASTK
jgi:lactoylglutathione lyase